MHIIRDFLIKNQRILFHIFIRNCPTYHDSRKKWLVFKWSIVFRRSIGYLITRLFCVTEYGSVHLLYNLYISQCCQAVA